MKKWLSVLAMLLVAVLVLTACGAKEDKSEATKEPAPTEAPKSEEELILERDTAAIKLAVEVTKTMKATAGEKAAAEEEGSKIARYYKRISNTSIDNPYRAVVLTPTDEQFQTVKNLTGIDAAAYAASGLSRMQDAPADDLFYYAATGQTWGLLRGSEKLPVYYVFKAFAALAAKGEALRVDAPSRAGVGRYVLAAKHGGRGFALVTNFRRGDDCRVSVRGAAARPASVRVINDAEMLEETADWEIDAKTGELVLIAPVSCPSAVWLVEWKID